MDSLDSGSSFGDTNAGPFLYSQGSSYDSSGSSMDTTKPLFDTQLADTDPYDEELTPSELFYSGSEPSHIRIPLQRSNTSDHSAQADSRVDMSIASTIISGGPSTSLAANSSSLPSFSPPSNNFSINSVGTQSESMILTQTSIQAPDTPSSPSSQLNNSPSPRTKSGKNRNNSSVSKHSGLDLATSRKSSPSADRGGDRTSRLSFLSNELNGTSSPTRDDRALAVKLAKAEGELIWIRQLLQVVQNGASAAEARVVEVKAEAKKAIEKAEGREVTVKAEAEARVAEVKAGAKEAIEKAEAREATLKAEAEAKVAEVKAEAEARVVEVKAEAEARVVEVKAEAEARVVEVKAEAREAAEKVEAREAAIKADAKEAVEKAEARVEKAEAKAEKSIALLLDMVQSKAK